MSRLPALSIVTALSWIAFPALLLSNVAGCAADVEFTADAVRESADGDGGPSEEAEGDSEQPEEEPFVPPPGWEVAPVPFVIGPRSEAPQYDTEEERAAAAEASPTWHAADGERYSAMAIIEGVTYGRRGPAPTAPTPTAENGYFSYSPDGQPPPSYEPDPDAEVDPEGIILCGSLTCDRRTRVTTGLTGFPERSIGAINNTSAPGYSNCTAQIIGPRHLLTAGHCIYNGNNFFYNDLDDGKFHPGQTASSNTNGVINFSSLWNAYVVGYQRDGYDYAVVYTDIDARMCTLGWMGVEFYNSAAPYVNKNARLLGYPGEDTLCQASTDPFKFCDGYMYRDSALLTSAAYTTYQLKYDIDADAGQSGAAVFTYTNNSWNILGVHYGWDPDDDDSFNSAARFRQSMWNNVCEAIGLHNSSYCVHPCSTN